MNKHETAEGTTVIRDTLPPADAETIAPAQAPAAEAAAPAEAAVEVSKPEEEPTNREEAKLMLGRQILDFLVEANQLSPRKRKKLEECLEDMEKQIRFREEATCNLPNLFAMQIETLHRYLVITERIGMYGGAVSASSRKIRRLIKRFEGLVRKPLRRQGKDFGLPDILTAVVED